VIIFVSMRLRGFIIIIIGRRSDSVFPMEAIHWSIYFLQSKFCVNSFQGDDFKGKLFFS